MEKKELKGYLKMMIGMLVISAIILFGTCFFNGCNIIQAVQMSETAPYVWLALILLLGAIACFVVRLITEKVELPSAEGEAWKKEQLLVCRYNVLSYCVLFVLCLAMALLMFVGAVVNFMSKGTEAGCVLIFSAILIFAVGMVFWLYMTRCVLIFYPEGLVYRDLRGNVHHVADEEVQYVLPIGYGKNRCFKLKTEKRSIMLGVQARHFYEAEGYAIRKYPSAEAYENRKSSN